MKIEASDEVLRATRRPAHKDSKIGDASFGAVFDDAVKTTIPKSEESVSAISLGAGVAPMGMNPFSASEGATVAQAERLIDLLADYKAKLEDPAVSLREIEPIMGRLDTMGRELVPKADALPANHALKEVLAQTLVTVTLELQRFNSGEYNP